MADTPLPPPEALRAARADDPKMRDRDLADRLGAREAQLAAAFAGEGVTRIAAAPSRILPLVPALGEVMGLTRNDSCVHEKVGVYTPYHEGPHAGIVLGEDIDLRIFPAQWVHGFAFAKTAEDGSVRRSLQVFDAAGDAIHKIFLRPGSDILAWDRLVADLRLDDQSQVLPVEPRRAVEGPVTDPARAADLSARWQAMTDTHQFLGLVKDLGLNRLGAYHMIGAPWARPLGTDAVDAALTASRDAGIGIMIFVGNRGCIQIHSGPVEKLVPMGPWSNVMDPGFNLHLRRDHIAQVWAVTKPTDHGAAVSIEAFDAQGGLILQMFPIPKAGKDSRTDWGRIVDALPTLDALEVA